MQNATGMPPNMQGQPHPQQGQQDMPGMPFDLSNGPQGPMQNGPNGPPGNEFGLPANMDFAELSTGDVLDTFDFDSFLQGTNDPTNDFFDANMAFGDVAPMEADLS
jgi:hypothetical protein